MNTSKNIGSLIGGAAIVAVSVGLTAGIAPASAAPQNSPGVSMTIADDPIDPANYRLTIRGMFPMSEGDARDRINNLAPSAGMDYRIHADDPGDNDGLIKALGFAGSPGPVGGYLNATPYGLSFARDLFVPRGELDEDFCFSSGCGDDTDEIYVKVRFVQGNGVPDLAAYTNAVSGKYGPRFG